MIQLSETGEQLLPSFAFEVIGFPPYLCVPSPFSSYDSNSINIGRGFICKPRSLSCLPTVSCCSPLYSPFYHLTTIYYCVFLLFSVVDFQNPDILFLSGYFLQSFCVPESQVSCLLLHWRNYYFCHLALWCILPVAYACVVPQNYIM